jgi:RNA polymerase sigma factor (TIGR02999 family)
MDASQTDLQDLVERWSTGDQAAFDRLVSLLYEDLRRLAHAHLQRERTGHTLTTTALVHEAYLQMAARTGPVWQGRARFFALVSKVMRHVLVDYARSRAAAKRGGRDVRVPLTADMATIDGELSQLLAVDQALDLLSAQHERLVQIVECRFFGGMAEAEIAEALGVSERTVERDWKRARAYLQTILSETTASGT